MGRYFTKQQLVKKEIPGPVEFLDMVELLEKTCNSMDMVVAATLIGSTVRDRDHNQLIGGNSRSDIDAVLVHTGSQQALVGPLLQSVMWFANRWHVPIKILPYHLDDAERFGHDMGPGFAEHVRNSASKGGCLKGSFDEFFNHHLIGAGAEALSYVTRKRAGLIRSVYQHPYMEEREGARFFTKLIEAPTHAVRRVLTATHWLTGDDSKAAVKNAYLQHPAKNLPRDAYLSFLDLDERYTEFVESVRTAPEKDVHTLINRRFANFEEEFLALRWSVPEFLGQNLQFFF